MNKFRKLCCLVLPLLFSLAVQAQENAPEATGFMRSNGKIYVVVAVVLTILIGLFLYVFSLDRKISRIEKS